MEQVICNPVHREPWNKGKLVRQKAPLKLKDILIFLLMRMVE